MSVFNVSVYVFECMYVSVQVCVSLHKWLSVCMSVHVAFDCLMNYLSAHSTGAQ